MDPWLARLRHDLVKQVVWRARDLRDLQQAPTRADLLALRRGVLALRDDEGRAQSALALWQALRDEALGYPAAALDAFGAAVAAVQEAAQGEDAARLLATALALEDAFLALSAPRAGG